MQYIKKNNLKNLIETSLHNYLDKENYEVFELDAKNLISPNRLDLIYKIVFLREFNKRSNYSKECYLEHIRSFNFGKYFEFGNPKKNSAKNFLKAFEDIDKDIQINGFDSSKSLIPLAKDGTILNGSHRIASSIVRDKKVSCIKLSCEPCNYDYSFFVNRLVNQIWLEEIIFNYILESNNFSVALIWPRANINNKILKKIFKKIIYFKEIKLNLNGLDQLIKVVYKSEDWINKNNNYKGSFLKTTKCYKYNNPLKIIIFESKGHDYDLKIKYHLRNICKVGNHSIHTTDNKSDSIKILRLLLNKNAINFINNHYYNYKKEKFDYLNNLEKLIKNKNFLKKDFIMSYKSSLYLYGLIKSNASNIFEIYTLNHIKAIKNFKIINFNSRNKLCNEIFHNPKYFFCLNNLKFISINGILYLNKIGFIQLNNREQLKLKKINHNFNTPFLQKIKLIFYYFWNIFKFKTIECINLIRIYLREN